MYVFEEYFQVVIIRICDTGDLNAWIDNEPLHVLNEAQPMMSQMWVYIDGHITDHVATDSSRAPESCDVCSSERARFLRPFRPGEVEIYLITKATIGSWFLRY